jgi:hypothetical protein
VLSLRQSDGSNDNAAGMHACKCPCILKGMMGVQSNMDESALLFREPALTRACLVGHLASSFVCVVSKHLDSNYESIIATSIIS